MASIESTPDLQARRFLIFAVAGRLCACDLDVVREIVPTRTATRLPGAPAWIRGIMNLRGTLLTVVDLAVRFGAVGKADGMRPIIVVEASGKVFGIGVDEVRGVQAVGDPIAVLPVVCHLLWTRVLQADLGTAPLGRSSLITTAGGAS